MEKLMKKNILIPVIGLIVGMGLIIATTFVHEAVMMHIGLVLVHICGWWMLINFLLIAFGFYSVVLSDE